MNQRQTIARIADAYGGLPRLFAVSLDTDHPTGAVAAWGLELPDGSAITCKPGGGAFGSWESSINAAVLLGDGTGPVYLTGPDA